MDFRRRQALDRLGLSLWERRETRGGAPSPIPIEATPVDRASIDTTPIDAVARLKSDSDQATLHVPAPGPGPGSSDDPPVRSNVIAGSASNVSDDLSVGYGANGGRSDAERSLALLSLPHLAEKVASCTRCALSSSRRQTVFGVGPQSAKVMIIGEAPRAEDDRCGEPFVGAAGQLLNAMLASIGVTRDEVYISNILKCHPPGNRDPSGEEVNACSPYLRAQVRRVAPRLLVAVGSSAAQTLLETSTPLGKLRGGDYVYANVPLLVTYHPADLLRSPLEKRKAWQDLKILRQRLQAV
jgi:uracil-DNA glycosylase family 4